MKKLKKKRIFVDPHYVREFEAYLKEMAEKGLVLERYEKKKCYFRETEPVAMEYRVVINPGILLKEDSEPLEQAGYRYITSDEDVHILGAETKDIGYNVYRNVEMEIRALDRRKKRYHIGCLILLGVMAFQLMMSYSDEVHMILIATVLLRTKKIYYIYGAFILTFLIMWGVEGSYINRRKRALKESYESRYVWKPSNKLWVQKISAISSVLFLIGSILMSGASISVEATEDVARQVENEETVLPIARLEQIEERSMPAIDSYIIKQVATGMIEEEYSLFQKTKPTEREKISYYGEYIQLKKEWLVARFIKEQLVLMQKNWYEQYQYEVHSNFQEEDEALGSGEFDSRTIVSLTEEGLDHVYYVPRNEEGVSFLAIAKGKDLVFCRYRGEKTDTQVLQRMKESLYDYMEKQTVSE